MSYSYLLIVVLAQFSDYESCNGQAKHENAYLETIGTDVATCIVKAPYAPIITLRPTPRPFGVSSEAYFGPAITIRPTARPQQ